MGVVLSSIINCLFGDIYGINGLIGSSLNISRSAFVFTQSPILRPHNLYLSGFGYLSKRGLFTP
jgi:hypothetical protein